MKLTAYALLHAVWRGHLSAEDAADALGIPARNVKTQVNYFGDRLEQIAQALDELTAGTYSSRQELAEAKRAVAERLGVSPRQINRFLSRTGLRPRPETIKQREEASAAATDRRRQQRMLALDVLYGRKSLEEAAEVCGRHTRTMRRCVDSLPIPVRYPDFDALTFSTRYALGKNVEDRLSSEHLTTLVDAQLQRGAPRSLPSVTEKPLISLMIAWLEEESDVYDPGFEHFLDFYGLKGRKLTMWERQALADELRNLL
jgi:hypothetical protein